MWRQARASAQKLAILNKLLPMTASDYMDAVVFFIGDADEEVQTVAHEKLRDMNEQDIIKRTTAKLPDATIKELLKKCISLDSPGLVGAVLKTGKVKESWILEDLLVQKEHLWNYLVKNRDFSIITYHIADKITTFLSTYNSRFADSYKEHIGYVDEADVRPKEPIIEDQEEATVEPLKDDDDDDEVVDLETDEIEFDVPDFMMVDEAFEGVSPDEAQEKRKTMAELIRNMKMGEKIKLAMMGNLEARKILIKDPRKQIAMAVLGNGQITDKEIGTIAGDKAMHQEIIAKIANTKQLCKSYAVKKALVMNPKCPAKIAMRLIDVMRMKDLKTLAKSKEVSNVLKNYAKKKIR